MRSGTIDLPSGRWHWVLLPQWMGATVVFHHRDRVHDEMRSWTPDTELTGDEARELALDALERIWTDVAGLKWRVSIELPSGWRNQAQRGGEEASVWLIFKRGGVRRLISLREDTRIGNLTHEELRNYLELASRRDADPHG